jgi:Toprim-like
MDVQEELLQRFAKMIELPAFMGQQGFELAKHPEPGRLSMTRPSTGETLLLDKDVERGGWSYVNPSNPTDRGSVVDFVTRRDGVSRKECLDRLLACCDERGRGSAEATRYRAFLGAVPEDLARATRDHEQTKRAELAVTKMLERLGVARGTLDEWRFGGVKRDADVTALITEPQALWASKYRPGDKAVVLVERPIDAIAYERAHGRQGVCYLATGSKPSDEQRRKLAHVLAEVPDGARVVLAYGRDDAGRKLAAEVQSLVPLARMERHAPELGARWADQMQLERRHALSLRKVGPALER